MAATSETTPRCHELLSIPLLLEMILVNLVPRDLLVSIQRVSKVFREAVQDTPSLQRALFYRWQPSDTLTFNPFLHVMSDNMTKLNDAVTVSVYHFKYNGEMTTCVQFIIPRDFRGAAEGSWRGMLVGGEEDAFKVCMACTLQSLTWRPHRCFFEAKGYRLGELYDMALEIAEGNYNRSA